MKSITTAIVGPLLVFLTFSSSAAETVNSEIVILEGEREIALTEDYRVITCRKIGFAHCPICMDTPSYYFYIDNRQLLSRCGGACWHPRGQQREICRTLCPPPQWDCKN